MPAFRLSVPRLAFPRLTLPRLAFRPLVSLSLAFRPLAAFVVLALLVPLALVEPPPLLDWPNHLARGWLLAGGMDDPFLARVYAPRWAVIPNLATDMLLPPLLGVLPLPLAGGAVLALAVLLPVLGAVAYGRAVTGERSAWPLGAALVAYNGALLLGFINFAIALGLALLLAAGWVRWRSNPLAIPLVIPLVIPLACAGAAVLFLCHLAGLAVFLLLLAAHEGRAAWTGRRRPAALLVRLLAVLPVVAVPAALYAVSPLGPMAPAPAWGTAADKAAAVFLPFLGYWLPLDIASAAVAGLVLLSGLRRAPPEGKLALAVLALLFMLAPAEAKGGEHLDARFAVAFVFVAFAVARPAVAPRTLAALLAIVFMLRLGLLAGAWLDYRHDLAAFRAVIAAVPPGSRVFVAGVSPAEAPAYWRAAPRARRLADGTPMDAQLAALLPIERRAFWPFQFDNESQQPIATLPPFRDLALRVGAMPDSAALADPGRLCGFDYALLMDARGAPPPGLPPVADSAIATLYRLPPCLPLQPAPWDPSGPAP